MSIMRPDTGADLAYWNVDTISKHPLWPRQEKLERYMSDQGAEVIQAAKEKARSRGQMTRTKPIRHLLADWLPFVSRHYTETVRQMRLERGVKSIALPFLEEIDADQAAYVGLRACLDGILSARVRVMTLAASIGRTLEHEHQLRLWEKAEPDIFWGVQRKMDREHATDTHRGIVNVNRFNSRFDIEPWGHEIHYRIGAVILEMVFRVTNWFEFGHDPQWIPRANRLPDKVLLAKPDLLQWYEEASKAQEDARAIHMPCVVPPRRWEGCRIGAYWTPFVRSPKLIRFKTHQEKQREGAMDEYDALEMEPVYRAIHFVQEVGWKVNRRVFEVATHCVRHDIHTKGMPPFRPKELPKRPWAGYSKREQLAYHEKNPHALVDWKRLASPIYRENMEAIAKRRGPTRTLGVASQLLEDVFYFPHMLDFRGRMYPIPVGLQPQGDDLARGLLLFAQGKCLGKQGAEWLAIHLASCWGKDKVSFAERIAWVHERAGLWRDVARDPVLHRNVWASEEVDKPFQTLAAILDWVGFLEDGEEHVSHLPVSVDGTCNGIQHLSAMTRDRVAGAHVNLTPGSTPRDIYQFVADRLQEVVAQEAKLPNRLTVGKGERAKTFLCADSANYWLDTLGRDGQRWSRKLTKRPVMVVPYGGTREAFFKYVREWIGENLNHRAATTLGPSGGLWSDKWDDLDDEERGERQANLVFLVNAMERAVGGAVSGAKTVMEWLQKCAKIASVGNQPIRWDIPLTGFVVRHFYGKVQSRKVDLLLDGTRCTLRYEEVTDQLDVKNQLQGVAPNFVHSQDAAAMTLCINRVHARGVTAFTAVHDAFGTHACDMPILAEELREAFIQLHRDDVLLTFRVACLRTLRDYLMATKGLDVQEAYQQADEKLPPLPRKGDLDIEDIRKSDYFFA